MSDDAGSGSRTGNCGWSHQSQTAPHILTEAGRFLGVRCEYALLRNGHVTLRCHKIQNHSIFVEAVVDLARAVVGMLKFAIFAEFKTKYRSVLIIHRYFFIASTLLLQLRFFGGGQLTSKAQMHTKIRFFGGEYLRLQIEEIW